MITVESTDSAATASAHRFRSSGVYFAKRLGESILTVFAVSVIVFIVTRLLSDPVRLLLPVGSSEDQYRTLSHQLGFDRSLAHQFREFLANLAQFKFGNSVTQGSPAGPIVYSHLQATAQLVLTSILAATIIGITFGAIAALRRNGFVDRVIETTSLVGLSLPQFWLGALLILFFSVHLRWLPASGAGGINHMVLPVLTLAIPSTCRIALLSRSTIIDELNSRYAIVAETKGLSRRYVIVRHCLRNALAAITTLISIETIKSVSAYVVIVEVVFAWPGIGQLLLHAMSTNDVFLIQATVFVVSVVVVVINLLADVVHAVIDPRLVRR